MAEKWSKEQLMGALEKYKDEALEILNDDVKVEGFLQKVEDKLEKVPKVGDYLAEIPVMMSMVRSYIKKDYVDVPKNTLIAMVAGLLYFLAPIDLIPDFIGVAGYLDDAAVIALVLKMVEDDIKDYKAWQINTGKRDV